MYKTKIIFCILLTVQFVLKSFAQPASQIVKILVSPDHANWIYRPGEKVRFSVSVLQYGHPVKNVKLFYEVGPEKQEPIKKDSMTLPEGKVLIEGGTMNSPGFLRCIVTAEVNGKKYRNLATAGFEPESIKPAIENPTDFVQFWDQAKMELSKVPLDARMILLPERCTETVNVYHVNLQNFRIGARLYGILCVPKKEGKYPALLKVPGAGIRPYFGDVTTAAQGFITFEIGIHGIPVNLDLDVYNNLSAGALNNYPSIYLENRDRYYYKRVYMGCVRANDFLVSLPQFDGSNLAVTGGSQGGALSIITAALDTRVKFLAAYYPALSDLTGYLKGRAGGWPHLFDRNNLPVNNTKEKIETAQYYDVVNFARLLKVPGIYSWGFNDETCPPTSMYAAYNVITAPKSLYLSLETGHWTYPEQTEMLNNWLIERLRKK